MNVPACDACNGTGYANGDDPRSGDCWTCGGTGLQRSKGRSTSVDELRDRLAAIALGMMQADAERLVSAIIESQHDCAANNCLGREDGHDHVRAEAARRIGLLGSAMGHAAYIVADGALMARQGRPFAPRPSTDLTPTPPPVTVSPTPSPVLCVAERIAKRCACTATYTEEQWRELPLVSSGFRYPGSEVLEMRQCRCRSTLAREVKPATEAAHV